MTDKGENRENVSQTHAWQDQMHAKVFDYMHNRPKYLLKKQYESYSEGQLLKKFSNEVNGSTLFEFGCATGELYRYLSNYLQKFDYSGFDISEPAIRRAKEKYPGVKFNLVSAGFDGFVEKYGRPDVLWCRDVVLHQEHPYVFLNGLIELAKEMAIVRVRTRDVGDTELDSNVSCQLHWDNSWVPYMVLNTDEMIEAIKQHEDVNKIIICRSYEVLGGHNSRFVPKELYFSDAKTAETAVYVQKGLRHDGRVEVSYMDRYDRPKYGLIDRIILKCLSFCK